MRQWYTYCLLIACFLFFMAGKRAPGVFFVKPTASGNGSGSSWDNASADLQAMINAAAAGDEIWVAAGTYKPASLPGGSNTSGPRDVAFVLKSDVKIYGGFSGTETALGQRNATTNTTTLSGDIGVASDATDNAYHVVVSINNTAGTLLDGFTVSGGNANGEGFYSIDNRSVFRYCGGGILARGSSATFSNIIVASNQCATAGTGNGSGAGIYSINSSLVLKDARLQQNKASSSTTSGGLGGGLCMIGTADSVNNTSFTNVTVTGNETTNAGAGIFVQAWSKPVFTDVVFTENIAGTSAGGLIIIGNSAGNNVATLNNVSFTKNKANAGNGGALFLSNYVNATMNNLSFTENESSALAGALYCIGGADAFSNLEFTNTSFTKNKSGTSGGAMYINNYNNCIFNKASFTENSAGATGGAMFVIGASAAYNTFRVTDAVFSKNKSTTAGGAGYISSYNKYVIDRVKFLENEATASAGGGLFIFSAATGSNEDAQISNCLFYGNRANLATLGGGGIFVSNNSRPIIINSTFYSNYSLYNGGGIGINNSATAIATVYNSIFYGNTTGGASADIEEPANAGFFLKNSLTQTKGTNGVDGVIVGSNPSFLSTDPASADFLRLASGSPAIDKGANNLLPAAYIKDLAGGSRINDNVIDMGAYESGISQTPTESQTITFENDINLQYGDADHDPAATASSGLQVTYTSSDLQVATIVSNQIRIVGAGTAEITASQPGNQTYLPATPVKKILTVSKAPLIIKPANISVEQYLPFPGFTAVYTSFVNGDNAASLTTQPTITTTANSASAPGDYTLTASDAASPNYTITYETGTLTILPGSGSGGNVHYVKQGGTGNGSSWANASGNLQAMINAAAAGDQIWVAGGTYKPATLEGGSGTISARDVAFVLKNDVKIFGGFAGTETIISDRNTTANPSILSGDIGTVNDASDNAYHVVLSVYNTASTLLDGFTITGGNADGEGFSSVNGKSILRNSGGGIHARGSKASFSNSIIKGNSSATTSTPGFGGGVYSYASQIQFQDALITQNSTVSASSTGAGGGGIYTEGNADTASTVTLTRSDITFNTSRNLGGGIYMGIYSTVTMKDGNIADNKGTNSSGGGVFSRSVSGADNHLILERVNVSRNETLTGSGGGMMLSYYTHSTFTDVVFSENKCISSGAGYYLQGNTDDQILAQIRMTNVEFRKNQANGPGSGTGGAVYLQGNWDAVFTNVKAIENYGNVATGAFQIGGRNSKPSNLVINGGSFINNRTPQFGAAIVISTGAGYQIDRVDFSGNSAGAHAGAVWASGTGTASGPVLNCTISNSRFANNESGSQNLGAGALYITTTYNTPRILNCTFYNNKAQKDGGAIYVGGTVNTKAAIHNCIIYGNSVINGNGADIYKNADAIVELKNTLTQAYGTNGVDGVITGVDPKFLSTDANSNNYLRLMSGSPAIDKGDNLLLTQGTSLDLGGNARIVNGIADMGAYEYFSGQSIPTESQTIDIAAAITKTYGEADFDPGATASSGLTVYYTSNNTNVATIENGKVKIKAAGTATIRAWQPGNDIYLAAPDATTTLTVNKAPLLIKANDANMVQQQAIPAFTASFTGFVNGETLGVLSGQPVFNTTATTSSPIGTYPITVSGAAAANYEISYTNGVLTIQPIAVDNATLDAWFSNNTTLQVRVDMPGETEGTVSLFTSAGQRIYHTGITLKQGRNQFTVPADRLIPGIYIINVNGAGLKLDKKFIKR
ncbi:MBG domain-containing protein [Pseudobacter ginsenosidimutans]|uniref:Putative secreted protein (Por secretion system target) n=1 Tax=Pseudobacter ginsenosidimutans TaxID=661488 RepID=A0A4Q7MZD5_9BACT|nr:MBG domain-containing protein [Pseudobacter ginsenosidimutans]QEC43263.1 T9SS type A sorting domain-containing protein [Pseudobacter ginsenosidimutans]RZS74627.1 putative secreted protein (Por secretion system target) [Pseudobacter ginsenosidimutans]